MDLHQFTRLQRRREPEVRHISIRDFLDQSDRTLSITRKIARFPTRSVPMVHHFFLLDGQLHSHNYEATEKPMTTQFWSGEKVYAPLLQGTPGPVYRAPVATDFEFAEMMENLDLPLSFYDFESPENQISKIDGYFYGLITRTEPDFRSAGFRTFTKHL